MSSLPKDCLESVAIKEFQKKYKLDCDEIFDLAQTFFNGEIYSNRILFNLTSRES